MSTSGVSTTGAAEPASIARIRRLERLEQERLDEKARRDERRRQRLAGNRPAGDRSELVDQIERFTRYLMLVLGIAWLVVDVVVAAGGESKSVKTALVATLFLLWLVLLG